MRIETAIKEIERIYEEAKKNPQIRKPVSYSLYQAWLWASSIERDRTMDEVQK